MPLQASTTVKTVALLLLTPTLLVPMKAAAQQMLGGPDFAKCDTIKDPAKSAQCTRDATMDDLRKRNEAALDRQKQADGRVQVAQVETTCAEDVSRMRAADPKATEIAKDLVKSSGRPAAEYGICRLRDGIRAGLAARK